MLLRIKKFIKDLLLFIPLSLIAAPLTKIFLFLSFYNKLIFWIYRNKKGLLICDFYSPLRNYEKRYLLYQTVLEHYQIEIKKICYLEFGVASGSSFNWWLTHNKHSESKFRGFDTFEGLPEKWGGYEKGAMAFDLPITKDPRSGFYKGLFQDTLNQFLSDNQDLLKNESYKRIIHLDADLYSSTAFVLSQLYPYLKKGDLILFDEFNVPLHEFRAYDEFTRNFYINLKPIASVNNFYQTAFVVE
jgi:hypothetical protein